MGDVKKKVHNIKKIKFDIIKEVDLSEKKEEEQDQLNHEEEKKEVDLNIEGMPKVGQISLKLNKKVTDITVQIYPDRLFIIVTQIKKIANMIHLTEPKTNMMTFKKMKPQIRVSLGVHDQFTEFLGKQIYNKYLKQEKRKTRPMTF